MKILIGQIQNDIISANVFFICFKRARENKGGTLRNEKKDFWLICSPKHNQLMDKEKRENLKEKILLEENYFDIVRAKVQGTFITSQYSDNSIN